MVFSDVGSVEFLKAFSFKLIFEMCLCLI